jgi:UDP-N-acetylmuramyl tripeptide synthase
LLREKNLEAAVLEVARGGLLRRGLPIADVDAAIITNVAEDHLGQYGINDLAGLTLTKFMVAKGLSHNKPLILNADDLNILQHYKANHAQLSRNICWFSIDENNPKLVSHRQLGGSNCFVRNHRLIYQSASEESDIIGINEIPMTLKGAALHNVRNALGAIATAKNMGLTHDAIRAALQEFKSDASDNPGRGNLYNIKGATVIVDFAHNVHSMDAMANTLNAMPAKRKILMLGHAGDRSNAEIAALTQSILAIHPDQLIITETPEYLRGRELGEIPNIIGQNALKSALTLAQLTYSDSPLTGAKKALSFIEEGDLVFLMVLSQRDKIDAFLTTQID